MLDMDKMEINIIIVLEHSHVRVSPGAKCTSINRIDGGVENTGIDLLSIEHSNKSSQLLSSL